MIWCRVMTGGCSASNSGLAGSDGDGLVNGDPSSPAFLLSLSDPSNAAAIAIPASGNNPNITPIIES